MRFRLFPDPEVVTGRLVTAIPGENLIEGPEPLPIVDNRFNHRPDLSFRSGPTRQQVPQVLG